MRKTKNRNEEERTRMDWMKNMIEGKQELVELSRSNGRLTKRRTKRQKRRTQRRNKKIISTIFAMYA